MGQGAYGLLVVIIISLATMMFCTLGFRFRSAFIIAAVLVLVALGIAHLPDLIPVT